MEENSIAYTCPSTPPLVSVDTSYITTAFFSAEVQKLFEQGDMWNMHALVEDGLQPARGRVAAVQLAEHVWPALAYTMAHDGAVRIRRVVLRACLALV